MRAMWLAAVPIFLATPAAAAAAADRPVVVELFTSQGCSSCPPADALLGRLAGRPGVLALAFHVDYWDRLGWRDPYADAAWTRRQRDYAPRVAGSSWAGRVYTPQMVVDGHRDVVGGDAAGIAAELARAAPAPAVPLDARAAAGRITIAIGAGTGAATLLAVTVDPPRVTRVARGENAGRTLEEARIVRALRPVAEWRGAALETVFDDPRGADQSLVLLLQEPSGRYRAAMELPAGG
jgi:hypothetical protein